VVKLIGQIDVTGWHWRGSFAATAHITRIVKDCQFPSSTKRIVFVESWSIGRDNQFCMVWRQAAFGFGYRFQQRFACPTPRDVK
jgi:hypothetical protein